MFFNWVLKVILTLFFYCAKWFCSSSLSLGLVLLKGLVEKGHIKWKFGIDIQIQPV